MDKAHGISGLQYAMISGGSVLIITYSIMPVLRSGMSNRIIIPVILLSFLFIMLFNIPFLFIANKTKYLSFSQAVTALTGNILGKIIAYIFAAMCLMNIISALIIITAYTNTYLLSDTPGVVVLLFALVPACYAAFKGAGTIGRMSVIIFPLIIFTIIVFFLFGFKLMDFSEIVAVTKFTTFGEIMKNTMLSCTRYSEIFMIFVFGHFLKKKKNLVKSYWLSFAIYFISVLLIIIPTLFVLGAHVSKLYLNPYFIYSRQVGGFDFAERIQSFNMLAWFIGAVMRISIYIFMASYILADTCKNKTNKFFVLPITIIAFIVCAVPFISSFNIAVGISNTAIFSWVNTAVVFGIPLILSVVYFIRKKAVDKIIEVAKEKEKLEENEEIMQKEI